MKELEELREKIKTEMNRRSGRLTTALALVRQGRNIAYGNVLEWIGKMEKEEPDVSGSVCCYNCKHKFDKDINYCTGMSVTCGKFEAE
jgi:hypothetical protein